MDTASFAAAHNEPPYMIDAAVPAPFYVGVAGKMAMPGYTDGLTDRSQYVGDAKRIYEWTWAVLDWLRSERRGSGYLNPKTGTFDPKRQAPEAFDAHGDGPAWAGLGLQHTPIVVLSSLAPGVDALVAEAALDYAEARGANVRVRAPLPFAADHYANATSFVVKDDPERTQARQARFKAILDRIERQGAGGRPLVFEVPLAPSIAQAFSTDELTAQTGKAKRRRHRRYRATGEYVAMMSHLLLAIDSGRDGTTPPERKLELRKLHVAGTEAAIEAKRHGASFGLLPGSEAVGWADNGPVLYAPLSFFDDDRCGEARFLHPYDSAVVPAPPREPWVYGLRRLALVRPTGDKDLPEDGHAAVSDMNPEWQRVGNDLFRRIAHAQDDMNARLVGIPARVDVAGVVGLGTETPPSSAMEAHLRGLAAVLALRERVAKDSRESAKARKRVLAKLAWTILLAAVLLAFYEQWYPALDQDGLGKQLAKLLLLVSTLGAILLSGRTYWAYRRSGAEQRRFDHRSIAEGLRVQIFWSACGIGRSVTARYMQRQRDELSWIRYAIVSSTGIATRWARTFSALSHAEQSTLLRGARDKWIKTQENYAAKAAIEAAGLAHVWHTAGWSLAAAGLTSVFGKLLSELCDTLHWKYKPYALPIGLSVIAVGAAFLLSSFFAAKAHGPELHSADHDPSPTSGFAPWILKRPVVWGWGLVLAGIAFLASKLLGSESSSLFPTAHSLWIVFAGMLFLGGALALAWAERRGFAEEARQNQALRSLHACAGRRLDSLIDAFAVASDVDERAALLSEIHTILEDVGVDALNENAEWLIRARSRPLEPFMAG